jgi:MFS family permease
VFSATVTFSLFTGTFALLGERHFEFSAQRIGYLLSAAGLVSAIVQGGLIGRLVKRFGELPLVAAGAAMFAVSMALTPLAHSLPLMLVALLLLGIGNGLNAPAILALISREASAEEQGRLLGFEQSLESIARIVGLVAGGWLFERAVGLPYAVGAGLMLTGCVLAASQMRRRPA